MPQSHKIKFVRILAFINCILFVCVLVAHSQNQNQQSEDSLASRDLCPIEVIRKYGSCDPSKGTVYKRVAKRSNSDANGNEKIRRIKQRRLYGAKSQQTESKQASYRYKDVSLTSSQKVGITVWKLHDKVTKSTGDGKMSFEEYPPVRISSDPTLAFGDKVRIGIESQQDGYLYVINRELYDDGTMSDGRLIFPTSQMRDGDNRIFKKRPIEVPNVSDDTFYFESEPNSLSGKKVLGEVLSIIITKYKIAYLENLAKKKTKEANDSTEDLLTISRTKINELENLYSGRTEVFEFENTKGKTLAQIKSETAMLSGNRRIAPDESVPQTLYLVEDKKKGGVLVTIALKYESGDKALIVGMDDYIYASPTPGGVNDAIEMANLLQDKLGFTEDSIKILTNKQATASNIRKVFREWLIEGTRPGDRIFFFFAGHGSQVPDENAEEGDNRDEVLAGYDVTIKLDKNNWAIPASNFIRDDEIEQWVAELSGRRVVFLIDSCHSGTISRSGGEDESWKESRFLRPKTGVKLTDQTVISPQAKDTIVKQDKILNDLVSNAVIISASKSDQEAMPVRMQNKVYGALTYSFIETLKTNDVISISDLDKKLNEYIKKLKAEGKLKAGRNGQFQEPEIEVLSTTNKESLKNQPLFGESWAAAPVTALLNPLSSIKVSLRTEDGKSIYRGAEPIPFIVETNKAGYLYVLVFSETNVASVLFPNNYDKENYVSSGKHRIPRKVENQYEIKAIPPFGQDVWVAIVSDQRLNLGDKSEYKWNEVFNRIGLDELQKAIAEKAKTRGAGVTALTSDWQAATITLKTFEK